MISSNHLIFSQLNLRVSGKVKFGIPVGLKMNRSSGGLKSSFPAAVASYLFLQLCVEYQATTRSMLLTHVFYLFLCPAALCCGSLFFFFCGLYFKPSKIQSYPDVPTPGPRKMPEPLNLNYRRFHLSSSPQLVQSIESLDVVLVGG